MSKDLAADYLYDLVHSAPYHRALFGLVKPAERAASTHLLEAVKSAADSLGMTLPKGDPVLALGDATNFKVTPEEATFLRSLPQSPENSEVIIHDDRAYIGTGLLPVLGELLKTFKSSPSVAHKIQKAIERENSKTPAIVAGLLLRKPGKILLAHPTNAGWEWTFSIPKGHLEPGEDLVEGAIRETLEEVGISVEKSAVKGPPKEIRYRQENGALTKILYYFVVDADPELPDVLPKSQLQSSEVDYAAFLTKKEAQTRVFRRFRPLLALV